MSKGIKKMFKKSIIMFALFALFAHAQSKKVNHYSNFYNVTFARVLDGDTIEVKIFNVPDVFKKIKIRLNGINTPELKSKNHKQKSRAFKAKEFTTNKLLNSKEINLFNCKQGTFFRLVCDVCLDGQNLSRLLLDNKLAVWYKNKPAILSKCIRGKN